MNMKKLTSDIHDINYLIVGLATFLEQREGITRTDLVAEVARAVNARVIQRALKYNLASPRHVGEQYCKKVIGELEKLGLINKVRMRHILTEDGAHALDLLVSKQTEELRRIFLQLMLRTYNQIEELLCRIYHLSPSGQIALPVISAEILKFYQLDTLLLSRRCYEILTYYLPQTQQAPNSMIDELNQVMSDRGPNSQKSASLAQSVVDKYMLSLLFSDIVTNKRSFDVILSRCQFLELANSAPTALDGFPCIIIYLTSYISPPMSQPEYLVGGSEIELSLDKKVVINQVKYDSEGLSRFREALKQSYLHNKLDFGYARIADLRTETCRYLRISDRQFDALLLRQYRAEPGTISLDYSFERLTAKASAIALDDEGAALYNLARTNY